ncbi:MAG TPA: hypothetical protein VMN81_06340 [Vicinamibacterales bacterium]|nr:hypothetical protein [Vicinamibacterales bacterium]
MARGRQPSPGLSRLDPASFRQGLTVNLLNPAITSFYVGLLRHHVEKPSVRRTLDAIAGLVLIALAVQVLLTTEAAGPR